MPHQGLPSGGGDDAKVTELFLPKGIDTLHFCGADPKPSLPGKSIRDPESNS